MRNTVHLNTERQAPLLLALLLLLLLLQRLPKQRRSRQHHLLLQSLQIKNTHRKKKSGSQSQNKKKVDSKKSKEYIQTNKKNNTDNNKSTNSSNPAKKVKVSTSKKISWSWPVSGKVIEKFSSTELGNKGVDIAGRRGSNIAASADGKVVYAGNALRGYGNLIIIKHNDDFLSAYAHNDRIFVREQQSVSKGQKIASMGSSGTNTVRLHFEIRYKGKSVDPLRYLPRR